MGIFTGRIYAPIKTRSADWIPEQGELFQAGGNLYMGDNVTASNALTPINGGGSAQAPVGLPYTFSTETSDSGISIGQVRINNVLPGSATTMWIAQTDDSTQDRSPLLNTLSAGGLVYVNTVADDGSVGVFRVTAMVDSKTYYTLTVDRFSGALPNDGAKVRVTITPVEVSSIMRYVSIASSSGTTFDAVELENTTGTPTTFTRSSAGTYNIEYRDEVLAGKKILVFIGSAESNHDKDWHYEWEQVSSYEISILTFKNNTLSDDVLLNTGINVMIYPFS